MPTTSTTSNGVITDDELTGLEKFLATFADSAETEATEARREYYRRLRLGWNQVTWRCQTNLQRGHQEALDLVRDNLTCLHRWVNDRSWANISPVLGTGERGVVRICTKCSKEDVVVTSRRRWSGD
jgi:hypothetical protein